MSHTETIKEAFTTTVTFRVTDYGEAVLVEVRPSGTRHSTIRKDAFVFSKQFFNRMLREHGGISWVLNTECCRVVTPEYYKHYTGGESRRSDFDGDRYTKDPVAALANGDFHLAVRDQSGIDGNFYGLDGRPVPRSIWLSYINGRVKGTREQMAAAEKKLSTHKQVTEVQRSEIPYFNASFDGEETVEFKFTPTPRQFARWAKNEGGSDSFGAIERIRKLVLGKVRA